MDSSVVYGFNKMEFTIENTLNLPSDCQPTVFDAGGFDYDQIVFNFSGVRQLDVGGLGLAGQHRGGHRGTDRELLDLRRRARLLAQWRRAVAERLRQRFRLAGVPGLPAFRRGGRGSDCDRCYVDLEANLTERLLGSVAVRAEDYSDFGSNLSGKLALRYDFTDNFALRGSVQNGFRAPSLQQQFFTTTSTNFVRMMSVCWCQSIS